MRFQREPRGAVLGNPRVNFPDPLMDAMNHIDGHGRAEETQNETTVAVSERAVCAAWNDTAFPACAAGFNDGANCDTTADCRTCRNTGGSCEMNGECTACVGGPNAGAACTVSGIRVCVGGTNDGAPCPNLTECIGGGCGSLSRDCRACVGGANDGAPCIDNSECPGGGCGKTCVGGTNGGAACTADSECPGGACAGGRCVRTCDGGANNGAPCDDNSECPGGSCAGCARTCIGGANDDGLCVLASECPGGRCAGGACEGQSTGFGRSPTGFALGAWTDQGAVFEPTTAGRNRSKGDPVMGVDNNENFYLAHMADTNGDRGIDSIYVQVSQDDCTTFPNPGFAASGAAKEGLDKPWLAVDRSGGATDGMVYVCWWDQPANRIMLATSPPGPPLAFGAPIAVAQPIGATCSGGANNGNPCTVNSECPGGSCSQFVQDCQVAVGPCGTVHITWTDYPSSFGPLPNIYYRSLAPQLNTCVGGANNAATCSVASECPGGTCGLGAAELVRAVAIEPGGRGRNLCSGNQVIPAGLGPAINDIRNREGTTLAVDPGSGVPYVAWNEGMAGFRCIGGANDGAACTSNTNNSECPGGLCSAGSDVRFSQRMSCAGGGNNGVGCMAGSECPGGACNATWSAPPVIVHPTPNDQFMPAMTVSPLSVIKIEYYDKTGGDIVLSDAVSLDGRNWVNEVVSTTPFTLDRFVPADGRVLAACYMGDYNGITADDIGFYHVWGDNRESQTGAPHNTGLACVGGANSGASCIADSECPGGVCGGNCVGGANNRAPCAADSECPGGACGHLDPNVFFDFQPTLRHFECDEVAREPFNEIFGLPLDDQFGPSLVNVTRPKRLCNPANKNDEDPLAPLDPDHLTGYVIRQESPPFSRILDQVVDNQFGPIVVDLVRPDYLMVPTAKSQFGPPPPLIDPRVNHYKCYKARGAASANIGVLLQDQFGTFALVVKRPVRLCVPADKAGSGILDPPVPMMCYKVRPVSGLPRFRGPMGPIYVLNQFGPDTFEVSHQREICVPSVLNPKDAQCPAGP